MKKVSARKKTPAVRVPNGLTTKSSPAPSPQKEAQTAANKPARYASPPCYLAELPDADFGELTSK